MPEMRNARMLEPDALVPIIPARGRAGSSWIWPAGTRSDDAVCLRLFLNLVNDHAARLIVRERLRMIAVARMHPHA